MPYQVIDNNTRNYKKRFVPKAYYDYTDDTDKIKAKVKFANSEKQISSSVFSDPPAHPHPLHHPTYHHSQRIWLLRVM